MLQTKKKEKLYINIHISTVDHCRNRYAETIENQFHASFEFKLLDQDGVEQVLNKLLSVKRALQYRIGN